MAGFLRLVNAGLFTSCKSENVFNYRYWDNGYNFRFCRQFGTAFSREQAMKTIIWIIVMQIARNCNRSLMYSFIKALLFHKVSNISDSFVASKFVKMELITFLCINKYL